MIVLSEHPALARRRKLMTEAEEITPLDRDADKLALHLRYLLSLDATAVYHVVGDSTVVYYVSPHGRNTPPGGCCRIVFAPDGTHRRIGLVGFDPRTAKVVA